MSGPMNSSGVAGMIREAMLGKKKPKDFVPKPGMKKEKVMLVLIVVLILVCDLTA